MYERDKSKFTFISTKFSMPLYREMVNKTAQRMKNNDQEELDGVAQPLVEAQKAQPNKADQDQDAHKTEDLKRVIFRLAEDQRQSKFKVRLEYQKKIEGSQ